MKKLYKALLYLRIEWNWWFILHYRKQIKPLLGQGVPKAESLEYQHILLIDQKCSKYCGRVMALTQKYLTTE